jgi:glycosyltransferase involved in cell wall biosynthesis
VSQTRLSVLPVKLPEAVVASADVGSSNEMRPLRHLCIVAAIPLSLNAFMAPHVRELRRTWRITLVASSEPDALLRHPNVEFVPIPIARRISPARDIGSLLALWRLFRRQRFDLVQSITPKAGLLAMVAGRLAGVPVRIHWFTGQVWATASGARRWLLKTIDRVLVASSTHLLADSRSQRAFLIEEGVAPAHRIDVIAEGSVAGVDVARFDRNPAIAARVRAQLGIPETAVVALYLGRLQQAKGVPEIGSAFAQVAPLYPSLHLLIVGPDEAGLRPSLERTLAGWRERVHFVDFTPVPQHFMAASDIFVMPSHREGFGVAVIQAAACAIPTVGTCIYGLADAVEHGETGLLVPPRDVAALADAMGRLIADADLRRNMGDRARQRVIERFTEVRLVKALCEFYEQASSAVSAPRC